MLLKEVGSAISSLQSFQGFLAGKEDIQPDSIPVNSEASKKRWANELNYRLRNLPNEQFLQFIKNGNRADQSLVMFYATCKHYRLITEYVLQYVLPKWKNLDTELTPADFAQFFHQKVKFDPALAELKESTITMLGTRVTKMLKEVSMLEKKTLKKQEYNPQILRAIVQAGDMWFLHVLLLNENDIKAITKS